MNRIHVLSIGLLFSKHLVLLGEQNVEREEMPSVFNFTERIYLQAIRDQLVEKSFIPDCPSLNKTSFHKQSDVEIQNLKRQEENVTGEERKIRNSFRSKNLLENTS